MATIWVLNSTEVGQAIEFNAHGEVKTTVTSCIRFHIPKFLETGNIYRIQLYRGCFELSRTLQAEKTQKIEAHAEAMRLADLEINFLPFVLKRCVIQVVMRLH